MIFNIIPMPAISQLLNPYIHMSQQSNTVRIIIRHPDQFFKFIDMCAKNKGGKNPQMKLHHFLKLF